MLANAGKCFLINYVNSHMATVVASKVKTIDMTLTINFSRFVTACKLESRRNLHNIFIYAFRRFAFMSAKLDSSFHAMQLVSHWTQSGCLLHSGEKKLCFSLETFFISTSHWAALSSSVWNLPSQVKYLSENFSICFCSYRVSDKSQSLTSITHSVLAVKRFTRWNFYSLCYSASSLAFPVKRWVSAWLKKKLNMIDVKFIASSDCR